MKVNGDDAYEDNLWNVSYSLVFPKSFEADISVELCNSVKSMKYKSKEVSKGSEMATFAGDITVQSRQKN